MAHIHSVFDSNEHFVIDPVTREITNSLSKKIVVMQYDHNSERFTFEIPKQVDGHNMVNCDRVEIHYINIDAIDKTLKSTGVYESNDIQISPDDNSVAVFSWLLSRNCTKYAGTLNFLIHFACTTDGVEEYAWNTAIFQSITIGNGMNNGAEVVEPFPDILAQWKAQLFSASETAVLNVTTAEANALAAIEAAGEAKKQSVLDSIPDEYEALSALADQNHRNKAGAIVLDAEGESIVVNDASEYPLQNLKVFGKSTQDGTPTPDAPVDIVSVENPVLTVCGKNLINIGEEFAFTQYKEIFVNIPAGTYVLSFSNQTHSGAQYANVRFKKNNVWCQLADELKAQTVTLEKGETSLMFYANGTSYDNSAGIKATIDNLMLSASDGEYEPYSGQTVETSHTLPGIPVSSGGNYTDANGQQWICDEVDLARGVYVQRVRNLVFNGEEEIDNTWYPVAIYHIHSPTPHIHLTHNSVRSSHFDNVSCGNTLGTSVAIGNLDKLGFASSDDLTAYFAEQYEQNNPVTIQYVIATPIETPLSDAEITAFKALHSNRPNTTILNDAGAHMAVSYVADTKTYIDNKIAEMMKGVTE